MLSYFIIRNGHQNSSTNLIHSAAFLQHLSWVMFVPSCNVWESMSLKDFTTWLQRRYLTWSASKMWMQEKADLVLSCCRSSQLCWHRGNSLCDSTLDIVDPIRINKQCLDIKTLIEICPFTNEPKHYNLNRLNLTSTYGIESQTAYLPPGPVEHHNSCSSADPPKAVLDGIKLPLFTIEKCA